MCHFQNNFKINTSYENADAGDKYKIIGIFIDPPSIILLKSTEHKVFKTEIQQWRKNLK
jgi:hypothetical protein